MSTRAPLLLLVLATAGCAAAGPPGPLLPTMGGATPFTCRGRLDEAPPQPERGRPVATTTPARVELIGEPPTAELRALEQARTDRLNVEATTTSLGELANAIGVATHLPIVVEGSLVDRGVSLHLIGISLEGLLGLLGEEYGLRADFRDGVLHLESEEVSLWRSGRPEVDLPPGRQLYEEPLVARLLNTPREVPAANLAASLCLHVASPRGRASVVGQQVLFSDTETALERAEQLVEALTARALPDTYQPREW